jgi:hypothetical protein
MDQSPSSVFVFTELNRTRVARSKTTGQIQNWRSFFEAGIAGVPPNFCVKRGLEFGARVRGGYLNRLELAIEESRDGIIAGMPAALRHRDQ